MNDLPDEILRVIFADNYFSAPTQRIRNLFTDVIRNQLLVPIDRQELIHYLEAKPWNFCLGMIVASRDYFKGFRTIYCENLTQFILKDGGYIPLAIHHLHHRDQTINLKYEIISLDDYELINDELYRSTVTLDVDCDLLTSYEIIRQRPIDRATSKTCIIDTYLFNYRTLMNIYPKCHHKQLLTFINNLYCQVTMFRLPTSITINNEVINMDEICNTVYHTSDIGQIKKLYSIIRYYHPLLLEKLHDLPGIYIDYLDGSRSAYVISKWIV
jgi:hypothetical protein